MKGSLLLAKLGCLWNELLGAPGCWLLRFPSWGLPEFCSRPRETQPAKHFLKQLQKAQIVLMICLWWHKLQLKIKSSHFQITSVELLLLLECVKEEIQDKDAGQWRQEGREVGYLRRMLLRMSTQEEELESSCLVVATRGHNEHRAGGRTFPGSDTRAWTHAEDCLFQQDVYKLCS